MIPVDLVCRDSFGHRTPETLIRKVSLGDIALPLVRIEASAKCAEGSASWTLPPPSTGRRRPLARSAFRSAGRLERQRRSNP
ncbi:pyocin activator PrtN family protein [Methylobacterium sp. J-070]|uniref:pyocin activator PrtN family protein n=1 Tax=Methylobacterium sp. J-070 TaxID=2836650 RepID=UPI00391C17B7